MVQDDVLHGLLISIADDVGRQAGAAANAIQHEFAIKMDDARRHMPKHQVASALQALAAARSAALAAAAQNASIELQGRQRAAIGANASRPHITPKQGAGAELDPG